MSCLLRTARAVCVICALIVTVSVAPAHADEVWVAPTYQTDLGGLGIGSNVFWPVSVVGAARLAWGVPNNLQTFQAAKVVLIPHAPGGAATLNVFICGAQNASLVSASCAGPFTQAFTGIANQLLEVDISAIVSPRIGVAGQNYLAVLAYTTPTTTTDHVVGLRFAYAPTTPSGVATLAANTFTGTQTAPAFVGDGSAVSNVNADLLDGLDSTAFAGAVHGHDVSQVTNAARLSGGNTFVGTQRIDAGYLDLDNSTSLTGVIIMKNGARFLHNFGFLNTFVGKDAGNLYMFGTSNTAIGTEALNQNTTGTDNTATGTDALFMNSSGFGNTASGNRALYRNTAGGSNTANGNAALHQNTTGSANTASGVSALFQDTTGFNNTASGALALYANTTGWYNTAVGSAAGANATTGSNNIYLGANVQGVAGEENTMYLGKFGTQTRTFIAGVRTITTGVADAVPVVIDSNGQLGTVSSSRRFKEDIRPMADMSRRLFQLRPVTFRYTQAYGDGSKPLQFGLVAEEVAEVFPELAVRNAKGEVETVHYETLNVLLLNELQTLSVEVQSLRQEMDALRARLNEGN